MKEFDIDGVNVVCPDDMEQGEVEVYAKGEIKASARKLAKIEVKLVGEEVEVKSYERSPIRRVRRITGYLSDASNFNDSKRAELRDRQSHI